MTVTSASRRCEYTGDASTTEFAVTFQFFELSVYVGGALKVDGDDYSVIQSTPGARGTVVFFTAPAMGAEIRIAGATRIVQETDYVDGDDFPADVHEAALDRLTMIAQEQVEASRLFIRAAAPHPHVDPLDFASNPGTIVFVGTDGKVTLRSAAQILGGIDIQDAIDSALAASISEANAAASAASALASKNAAAASAAAAADATGVLTSPVHFTALPEFEIGLRTGKNGGGDSLVEFYDDTSDAWRSVKWDDTAHDWRVEDSSGLSRKLWHEGNAASQAEAEAGTENTKGMTALRVAQAIAALAGDGAFPTGTIMMFGNTSAPPGWTKLTDLNDYAIRIVSGTVGTSGAYGYSTVFAARTPTGTVGGMVLDTSRIPSHVHSYYDLYPTGSNGSGSGTAPLFNTTEWRNTTSTGGGAPHDHGFTGNPMPFNVNTTDVIRAEKN